MPKKTDTREESPVALLKISPISQVDTDLLKRIAETDDSGATLTGDERSNGERRRERWANH